MKRRPLVVLAIAAALGAAGAGIAWSQESRPAAEAAAPKASVQQMAWLTGSWAGNFGPGAEFDETWNAPKGGTTSGVGRFVGGDKTEITELLHITERDGTLVMINRLFKPGLVEFQQGATEFTLLRIGENEAVFQNLGHDHPQRIHYKREGDSLTAVLESGEGATRKQDMFSMKRAGTP